ncbi:MAG: hypothetical protein GPI90_13280 [Microcystis aeruginosa K13-05]|nr:MULTISPECIES: hypothetical protein [Microcystis]MCE2664481.1 hypothetical protein [Microcystis sp. 53602_E8]MDJ0527545.1 hypothetical protein [Microcystis sp. M53600_WE12]NCR80954.1 hypothetical protein [Microcystis aeruginosa K13-10]NCR85564.1 hypothetical protein [Microcystis aeruginosa K13-05]MCZ8026332.1 hypothetical protein [Microcystis sp. LE19-10.1B]
MTILAGHGEKAMATSPENGFLQETGFLDIDFCQRLLKFCERISSSC